MTTKDSKFKVVPNGNISELCDEICTELPSEVSDNSRDDLNIALDELLENIKEHAHNGEEREVIIDWSINDEEITISIIDPTTQNIQPTFSPPDKEEINRLNRQGEPSGRGLFMIDKLVDGYRASNNGLSTNYILRKAI